MRIAFVWQESSKPEVFNRWNDGLRAAMRIIEQEHEVTYHEPFDDIETDLILYWEAPCTINGVDAPNWLKVCRNPAKKILLFAGGPLQREWVEPFDLVCVESKVNAEECEQMGIPYMTAFGINTDIFKPTVQNKVFDGVSHGTFAGWKHQPLIAEALGSKALLIGKFQEHEAILYKDSLRYGAVVLPQTPYELLPSLLSSAHVFVNAADYWGGGQRATLEALACGLPVVCMQESIKNREYVEESGCGLVVPNNPVAIRDAVNQLKDWNDAERAVSYVQSKWTHHHYAQALKEAISCQKSPFSPQPSDLTDSTTSNTV